MLGIGKRWIRLAAFSFTLCLLLLSLSGEAKVARPLCHLMDTIPPTGQVPSAPQADGNPSSPAHRIIKQVPKARNQVKPAVVPPVKLPVKPKIIKPKVVRKVTGNIL